MSESTVTKGRIECLDDGSMSLSIQFNPTSFKVGRKVNWVEQPAHGQPYTTLQFSHGSCDSLSMMLLLDTTESPDSVLPNIGKLYELSSPVTIADDLSRPPCILFEWESFRFQGVIQALDVEFLLFDSNGRPKRAQAQVSILGQAFAPGQSPSSFFGQVFKPRSVSGSGGTYNSGLTSRG